MAKVVDSWANKKATEDEKQLRSDDVVREEALRLLWHNGAWRFGVGGVHGQNFPPFGEDFPPNRYSYTENVNDFTNNDNDYIRFLESKVARLEYELSLKDSEVN